MKLSDARVLVVDDEPALCEIFSKWMVMAGCSTIRTARNGETALQAVEEEPIDVLVTDVRMPTMDGVTLVRTLVDRGFKIPTIIFVSGFGDVDHREMYGLGVEAFLSKPLRREDLMTAIEKAVAARDQLWIERLEIAPRQELDVVVPPRSFRLGRGGFSIASPHPLSQGRVAFQCRIQNSPRPLTGQGYVRWYSRIEQRAGIEFAFLEPISRQWILEEIEQQSPIAFVPSA